MKFRPIAALALAVVAVSACTPEEIAFWEAFHAEQPAEAEALLPAVVDDPEPATTEAPAPAGLAIAAPATADTTGLARSASAACPGVLSLTNTSDAPYTYTAVYGPTQWPLVAVDPATADYPLLQPGETATVDVSAGVAAGFPVNVYLNRGYAFDVTGSC
jgi:hypothetical protein